MVCIYSNPVIISTTLASQKKRVTETYVERVISLHHPAHAPATRNSLLCMSGNRVTPDSFTSSLQTKVHPSATNSIRYSVRLFQISKRGSDAEAMPTLQTRGEQHYFSVWQTETKSLPEGAASCFFCQITEDFR